MRSRQTVKITNNFDGRRKKDELDGKPADNSRGISGYFRSNGMSGITGCKNNKKNLTVICGIVALAQLITLYLGQFFVLPVLPLPVGAGRKSCWDRLYPW